MVNQSDRKTESCILLVDDDPSQLEILTDLINDYNKNIKIIRAFDGAEAWDIIQNSTQLGMVISDIQMPRMTGIELLKQVKEHYPTLPFLLITGNLHYNVRDVILLGALNLLFKPYSTIDLYQSVDAALEDMEIKNNCKKN